MKLLKPAFVIFSALSLSLSSCASLQDAQQEQSPPKSPPHPQQQLVKTEADQLRANLAPAGSVAKERKLRGDMQPAPEPADGEGFVDPHNTEEYARIYENPFLEALKNPLSTFSIDVDTASYSNVRRFIENNQTPPADAVRIEELINYFPYDYPEPTGEHPFSVTTNLSESPWAKGNKLLRIGLRSQAVKLQKLPAQNLVFLLDVSGSMSDPNKLPLLKRSLKLVVDQLREQDHVSIVVYAGAAGLVLPPTNGSKKEVILDALDRLEAGGSTAGSAGIQLAYETAKKNFRSDANNRVILATDGDFNVGPSSDSELIRMIEEKRKAGIYLTVLGYGMGNYKDSKMEQLADKGNGNYAYIDSLLEARKVLVEQLGGTMQTVAKDVKLQLEFNPAKVASYRLIGYENRLLRAEDFNDDSKDAGELGAGTSVTALYEIVPAGSGGASKVDSLRYQDSQVKPDAARSNELLTVKLRYKPPTSDTSKLLAQVVEDKPSSWQAVPADFRFAAAVASFGMQLRKSEYSGSWKMEDILAQARQGIGPDSQGYRQAFVSLAQKAELLQKTH